MPIIRVSGIPDRTNPVILVGLMAMIQLAVANVEPLNIPTTDVTVFFPKDQLKAGLGEELIAQIEGLYKKPERTPEVLKQLQVAVCECLVGFALTQVQECTYVEAMIMPMIEPADCTCHVLGKRTP
jgi:hypothetical protein